MATARKTKTTKAEAASAEEAVTVQGFKGFDKNLQCRGYQFEVGKTFEQAGPIAACSNGFHACENPWDVLGYYSLLDDNGDFNRFARVTLSGALSRHGEDSKIAAAKITLDAELRLPDFIPAAVKWLIEATKLAVSATVEGGAEVENSSGNSARIGSSGNSARIGSSGYYAQIGSSGDYALIGSSGYYARIGSSGNSARIGSSGDSAQIGSSGNSARIGSSGDSAQIGSSGDSARINASGGNAVIACAGPGARVKAGPNGAICIPWHDGKRTRFAIGYVGEDGIMEGVWYRAEAGKLVEATDHA